MVQPTSMAKKRTSWPVRKKSVPYQSIHQCSQIMPAVARKEPLVRAAKAPEVVPQRE